MNEDEGVTLPTGETTGGMDPESETGEGTSAPPVTSPIEQHKSGQKSGQRVKLSDILTRLEKLESTTHQASTENPPATRPEILGEQEKEPTSVSAGTSRDSSPTAPTGSSDIPVSGGDSLADTVGEIADNLAKPFKGLRLGSWNYGRKPK